MPFFKPSKNSELNEYDSGFKQRDSTTLQMTCETDLESSVENLSPIKDSKQQILFEHTNTLSNMPNIVNNNLLNEPECNYTGNKLNFKYLLDEGAYFI